MKYNSVEEKLEAMRDSYYYHNKDKVCECIWCAKRREGIEKNVKRLQKELDKEVFGSIIGDTHEL